MSDTIENPYRLYVLPLAYEQIGLLYAVLALSACHIGHLTSDQRLMAHVAVDYQTKAISALGAAIRKGCSGRLHENERDAIFATIQILLLHDVSGTLSMTILVLTMLLDLRFRCFSTWSSYFGSDVCLLSINAGRPLYQ